MLTTAGCVARKTRKGRTGKVRPSTNLLTNGSANSTCELRLQRLGELGIARYRADLIANFAWGEVRHS